MAENTRSSRLAIVEETTEGTLVDVSAGTQFIPLQPGFEFAPNTETLTNEELRGSIGASQPIQGKEQPSASFSQYLKHSGVEGQAPNYGLLIESAMGTASANATERLTAAASTVSVVKLASGGSDFDNPTNALGKAVLVKDGTNGYSIRPVDSRSSNDLTLGFDLANAPASGIGVGKCVNYTPADSSHPYFSSYLYRANGADVEAIAGCRVSDMTMNVAVGELITWDFSIAGTAFYFNPIRITSATSYIDFTDDDGTYAAQIPVGVYKTPHALAAAVTSAMNSINGGETHTCVFNSLGANKGKFKISSTGTLLSLLWNSGANTANTAATKLGYTVADDTGTAATTGYLSDSVQSYASAFTPSFDSADPMAAKYMEVLIGDASSYETACVQSMTMNVVNEINDVLCIGAESGVDGKVNNGRTVSIEVVAQLVKHDADKFNRYFNNSDVKFLFNFGTKSGGNWIAGKCGCIYAKSAKISGVSVGDDNGIVTMQYTIQPYVDASANPEVFVNFL